MKIEQMRVLVNLMRILKSLRFQELSHKKEGFEDSVAEEESEESAVGGISENTHEDFMADDISDQDEGRTHGISSRGTTKDEKINSLKSQK